MTRTITALFDRRADADAAEARLKASTVSAAHVRIHDQSSEGYSADTSSTHANPGMWGSVKNAFLPDEDRHTYEEGVRRGGFLLTADVSEEQVEEAVRVLEEADTVDIDERSNQWRQSGWKVPAAAAGAGAFAFGEKNTGTLGTTGNATEEVIPVVEEKLVVGKREVDRGRARVRSYVTEVPVHEQVRLREERINVQRRAVDRPITDADDAFRDRSIELTATGEEAVVGKTARVVEEVVVSKTSGERVEEIDDTVRRTDVEVDEDTGKVGGLTGTKPIDPAYRR
ncbi:YsnF/AvaK domain-containing protein [uncultured Sphingomonas sp.]|uniref:YsnF/AvaK domain-containing protein n=1 Tax=uncultured Sphingomonas sp. TaxID=158754 RepID=UPI0035CC7584